MQFHVSTWLKNYLKLRLEHPFMPVAPYQPLGDHEISREVLDQGLYQVVQKNGVMLGCPVIAPHDKFPWETCQFPESYAEIVFVYLETLFSVVIQENNILYHQDIEYSARVKRALYQILRFYLKEENLVEEDAPLDELLEQKAFLKLLYRFERELNKHIKVKKSIFSISNSLQNLFGFLEIYYFLCWNYKAATTPHNECSLADVLEKQTTIKKQVLLLFAALTWSDDVMVPIEKQMLQQYIGQARLPAKEAQKIQKQIKKPVYFDDLTFEIYSELLKNYLLQSLILLSLIDNQQAVQEDDFINQVAQEFSISNDDLDLLYMAVVEFFSEHGHNFDILKDNQAASLLDQYVRNKIMTAVKASLDNIMIEIKETGELSALLAKATREPLSEEEKAKVREQLLDIAKTVPALAIFCLPAGGVVLAVLIKLLPFNILPSAFQEDN